MSDTKGKIELTLIVKVQYDVDLKDEAYQHVKTLGEALCYDIHVAQDDPFMHMEGAQDIEVSGKLLQPVPTPEDLT